MVVCAPALWSAHRPLHHQVWFCSMSALPTGAPGRAFPGTWNRDASLHTSKLHILAAVVLNRYYQYLLVSGKLKQILSSTRQRTRDQFCKTEVRVVWEIGRIIRARVDKIRWQGKITLEHQLENNKLRDMPKTQINCFYITQLLVSTMKNYVWVYVPWGFKSMLLISSLLL